MFHLFNKVYLKPDALIKLSRERIVVSRTHADLPAAPDNLYGPAVGYEQRPATESATTFTGLLNRYYDGSPRGFFSNLLNRDTSQRITIYVDLEAFLDITAYWFRTLYPGWTDEQFAFVMRMILLNYRETIGFGRTTYAKLYAASEQERFTGEIDAVLQNPRPELHARWHRLRSMRWTPSERWDYQLSTSIEWQLPALWFGHQPAYLQVLRAKLLSITKKLLVREIINEIREPVLEGLANIDLLLPNVKFDAATDSLSVLVEQVPTLRFLTDERFTPAEADYVWEHYDLSTFADLEERLVPLMGGAYEPSFAALLRNDLNCDHVLTYARQSVEPARYFLQASDYMESVNPLLVNYVLGLSASEADYLVMR